MKQSKVNRVLLRECPGHSKHLLPTTQEKTLHMDITRWSTPKSDWLLSWLPKMEKLYAVSERKRPEADCASDHELLIVKFRLKLKKVGKTTRPFKYELNQIPYDFFLVLYFLFNFLLYNIILVLPYINMNPPWEYTCFPS